VSGSLRQVCASRFLEPACKVFSVSYCTGSTPDALSAVIWLSSAVIARARRCAPAARASSAASAGRTGSAIRLCRTRSTDDTSVLSVSWAPDCRRAPASDLRRQMLGVLAKLLAGRLNRVLPHLVDIRIAHRVPELPAVRPVQSYGTPCTRCVHTYSRSRAGDILDRAKLILGELRQVAPHRPWPTPRPSACPRRSEHVLPCRLRRDWRGARASPPRPAGASDRLRSRSARGRTPSGTHRDLALSDASPALMF
jgi:hypothetical protein